MKNRKIWLSATLAAAGLASALPTDKAAAQVPAAPAAPVAPAAVPGAIGGVPPPGGLLGNCIKAKAYCRARLCASPLGQLLNGAVQPLTAFSGGIIPPICPPNTPSPADLAAPAASPAGAAARIQADTAAAAARRAAVRYLGTVDCHYWPEAQLALANALRGDRNECVRLEAAWALTKGCCCTRITIEALSICVSGSERDGNPSETNERVKAAAHVALDHCLSCLGAVPPPPLPLTTPPAPPVREKAPPVERIPSVGQKDSDKSNDHIVPVAAKTATQTHVTPAEYYKHVEETPWAQVVANARATLKNARPTVTSSPVAASPESPGSLQSISRAWSAPKPVEYTVDTTVVAQPTSCRRVVSEQTVRIESPQPVLSSNASPFHAEAVVIGPPVSPSTTLAMQPMPAQPNFQITAPKPPVSQPVTVAVRPAAPVHVIPAPSVAAQPVSMIVPPASPVHATPASSAPLHDSHVATVSYQTPTPPRHASIEGPKTLTEQLVMILQNQPEAGHRAWAASYLSTVDGWTNPAAVQALVRAAREDRDPAVRVACIRSLAQMQVTTQLVVGTVQDLYGDPNAAVQAEARKAMAHLQGQAITR